MSCTGTDLRLARALRELGTVLVKEAVRGAGRLASPLRDGGVRAQVARSAGVVGGGGPGTVPAGWAVVLPDDDARPLRPGRPSVVARVAQGGCLLDLRCVLPDDDDRLLEAVTSVDAEAQRCT
jgi:L-seryl-tRNA(Ser) seleniumtransferase